jgi:hypothetical protein
MVLVNLPDILNLEFQITRTTHRYKAHKNSKYYLDT